MGAASRASTTLRCGLIGLAAAGLLGSLAACGTSPTPKTTQPTKAATHATFEGSPSEWLKETAQCLRDLGYQIVITNPTDGSQPGVNAPYVTGVPAAKKFAKANDKCAAKLGVPPDPQTAAEISGARDHKVAQYNCLVGLGYQPEAPPSLQSWDDQYRAGTLSYDPISTLATEQQAQGLLKCHPDYSEWW